MKLRRFGLFFVAWAFVGILLVQVFFAGLGIFADVTYWPWHRDFGYTGVHLAAIVLVAFAAISRLPRKLLVLAIILVLLAFIMPAFATLPDEYAFFAALHPVSAVILFGLSVVMAVRSRDFVPPPWGRAS